MEFPAYIRLFGVAIHPHPVFELAGYVVAFSIYALTRNRFPRAAAGPSAHLWIAVGAMTGALVGAKLLGWLEWLGGVPHVHEESMAAHEDHHLFAWLGGKTVVGGLLGGWAGVEIAKKIQGVRHSTGDGYVFPMIVGMMIGRVGCFLTGLEDMTHGVETGLPWAVDFGDGVARHPTQLYDVMFLLLVGGVLAWRWRGVWGVGAAGVGVSGGRGGAVDSAVEVRNPPNGLLFRVFFASYFGYRFAVEFLKPRLEQVGPFSAIQLASLAGCVLAGWLAWRMARRGTVGEARG